jgi:hypothetical protein
MYVVHSSSLLFPFFPFSPGTLTHTHTHIRIYMCVWSGLFPPPLVSLSDIHTHTHTHTHTYTYIVTCR